MKARKPLTRKKPMSRKPKKEKKPSVKVFKKKPKKTPIQRLEKEASILMGKWVNTVGFCNAAGRDGLECTRTIQNAHIRRRSRGEFVRFSPLNCSPLCSGPHLKYHNTPDLMYLYVEGVIEPGRTQRIADMDSWASKNCKVYFTHQELLEEYIAFYKTQAESGGTWAGFHAERYKDPIARLMEEFG